MTYFSILRVIITIWRYYTWDCLGNNNNVLHGRREKVLLHFDNCVFVCVYVCVCVFMSICKKILYRRIYVQLLTLDIYMCIYINREDIFHCNLIKQLKGIRHYPYFLFDKNDNLYWRPLLPPLTYPYSTSKGSLYLHVFVS